MYQIPEIPKVPEIPQAPQLNNLDTLSNTLKKDLNLDIPVCKSDSTRNSIFSIFHTLLVFTAIYLSFKCNKNDFNLGSFIMACCCPYLYITYVLATKGTCGILDKKIN